MLNMMLFTKNYQNWSMLVETTACQSWRVFLDTVYITTIMGKKIADLLGCFFHNGDIVKK